MPGVNEGIGWKGKKLLMNAVVKLPRVPLLEIGPTAPPNQEGIPGEDAVFEKVADTALGMSRRVEDPPLDGSHLQSNAIGDEKIGAEGSSALMHHALAAEAIPQESGSCDVVRMNVGFKGVEEMEVQSLKECDVGFHFSGNRVNQKGATCGRAAQKIGVGGGLGLKQLSEDHRAPPQIY